MPEQTQKKIISIAEQLKNETDENKQQELKRKLPTRMLQCWIDEGLPRDDENAHDNGTVIIDVDHLTRPAREIWEDRLKEKVMALNPILFEISIRENGFHGWFVRPVRMTIEEAQIYFCEKLGFSAERDKNVKNISRALFCVPPANILHIDYDMMFGDKPLPTPIVPTEEELEAVREIANSPSPKSSAKSEEIEEEKEKEEDGREYPTEYRDGITFAAIRDELLRLNPDLQLDASGEPMEGCRNTAEVYLASQLKYITDGNVNWLKQIIPNYTGDEKEWLNALKSAEKYPIQHQMSSKLRQAIKNLTETSSVNSESEGSDSNENSLPKRPAKLPKMIDVCTQVVPEVCRDYIAHAVIPLFANYLSDVKVWHPDNSLKAMFYYCIVVAPSESGKEAIKTLQEVIMDEIKQSDRHWREELAEYSKEEKRTRNNKSDERPEFPEGLHIQWLASSLTAAAFLLRTQWCRQAGNKSVYTYYPEIDALKGLETNGFKDFTTIIRNAFDNEEIGRECATSDGLTGQEKIAWNFNGSTTPENYQFFKGWVGNGTAGRIDFVTILPDPLQKKFKYLRVDDEKKEELKKVLQPYIDNLKSAKGNLECPEALELAERMEDYIDERKNLYDDLAAKYMGNRCKIIAFRIAMLLWIANGQEWTKEIEDFAWWCMEYGLAVKNLLFADQLQDLEKKSRRISSNGIPGRKGILELLPNDGFTYAEFFEAKKKHFNFMGNLKEAQQALNVLKSRGNVIKNEEGLWFKTEKYLKQHGQSA